MGYAPELDESPILDPSLVSYHQSQIGVFRWMVELGQLDINTEVLMLASCLDFLWGGYLESKSHVYGYLSANDNTSLALDPSSPYIEKS